MSGYLEYLKLKEKIEDKRGEKMSVKANKCMYYEKSQTAYKSCNRNEILRPCKMLFDQNCPNFYLYSQYDKDCIKKETEAKKIEDLRKFLWNYKNENKLSDLNLQLDIGISRGTIYNFMRGVKIKKSNVKIIENFVNTIRRDKNV